MARANAAEAERNAAWAREDAAVKRHGAEMGYVHSGIAVRAIEQREEAKARAEQAEANVKLLREALDHAVAHISEGERPDAETFEVWTDALDATAGPEGESD